MIEERKTCVKPFYKGSNCRYAKIVEETGQYPISILRAGNKNGLIDPSSIRTIQTQLNKRWLCLYCTHPFNLKERFIGTVEPYFVCYAPSDCPELQINIRKSQKPLSFFEKLKNFFKL